MDLLAIIKKKRVRKRVNSSALRWKARTGQKYQDRAIAPFATERIGFAEGQVMERGRGGQLSGMS
jgi:hypothetical protein